MKRRILGVLAGGMGVREDLRRFADSCAKIYAADSGQDVCESYGFMPQVVVGDMDSVRTRVDGIEYRELADQDSSDLDKLLAEVRSEEPMDLYLAGFEGDRFDHMLAGLGSVVRSGLSPWVLLAQGYGRFLRGGDSWLMQGGLGERFSVLGLEDATVSVTGARWGLESARLGFGYGASLSNEFADGPVEITVESGVVLVILDGAVLGKS
jgi:thiamine pyrophosphokinase